MFEKVTTKIIKAWKWLLVAVFGVSVAFAATTLPTDFGDGTAVYNSIGIQIYEICNTSKEKRGSIRSDFENFRVKNPNNSLRVLNSDEKAKVKICEISKIGSLPRTSIDKYEIEIVEISYTDKGLSVLARAWENGKQIGFGQDGSVDLERFIFTNPPVLIGDPAGDIIRERTDPNTGERKQRRLRENPKDALLKSLDHTISVVEKHGDENIISGKVGNTVTTFNPAAGTNSPVDGRCDVNSTYTTWPDARGATTATEANNTETDGNIRARFVAAGPDYRIGRVWVYFNTGTIDDGDTVTAATFSLAGNGGTPSNGDTTNIAIIEATSASDSIIATTDYDITGFGTTEFVTTRTTFAGWTSTDGTYNDMTLNASGVAFIDVAGLSRFGVLVGRDFDNAAPDGNNTLEFLMADETGTAADPKLVVTHSAPAGAAEDDKPQGDIIIQ